MKIKNKKDIISLEDDVLKLNEEFSLIDILEVIRDNPNKINNINYYIEKKKISNKPNINETKLNAILNINDKRQEKTIINKSIWFSLNENFNNITNRKVIYLYLNYLNKGLEKNFFDKYPFFRKTINQFHISSNMLNNYIYQDIIGTIKGEIIFKYKDFIDLINYNNFNLYINSFINKSYNIYLKNMRVSKVNDLKIYLNEDIYKREYNELQGLIPLLIETKNSFNCDNYINKVLDDCNKVIIIKSLAKGVKVNNILKLLQINYLEYKCYLNNLIDRLCNFFDSYKGRLLIKYLLSLNDGFFTKDDLKLNLPKNFEILIYLERKHKIYNLYYNEDYEIYLPFNIKDENIILNKYKNYINEDDYINLINELVNLFIKKGILINKDIVIKRVDKIYNKVFGFYAKGYISREYKVFNLYKDYIKTGISNIEVFINKYKKIYNEKIDDKIFTYVYFTFLNNKYYLKENILSKFYSIPKKYDNLYIYRICESYKSVFSVKKISEEANKSISFIKKMLNKSFCYYQIKHNTYIKSDSLVISLELFTFFKYLKEEKFINCYDKIKYRFPNFLNYYHIKNVVILKRLINKVILARRKNMFTLYKESYK